MYILKERREVSQKQADKCLEDLNKVTHAFTFNKTE